MGNRELLLDAAKRCLYDKGYTRTTARDVATAAGVSLAAIGYHYGTKEALLDAALRQALEEWGDDLIRVLSDEHDETAVPADRFAAAWDKVIASFTRTAPLWAVQFEIIASIDRAPEMRSAFAEANSHARLALVELFKLTVPAERQEAAGTLLQAVLGGLAAQWLVDPDSAPTGEELVEALRSISESLTTPAA
ncbi:TetR/AcrR family transcriptional regulator [Actinoplanes derwentensis]|uniref:DNA-binding transcriptional regulator, AcrR family n=1 Tax=Actinoplanes derwentensis TaxID=113562 RepID=A0A1H1UTD6_9ACTN|nr:TetR/AcrR family transcriptional regulator [Actinoplanes derwentensis]GID88871.1 TetR family transcriptional regulator [Actinoplanes derwentensis]SDS75743.1 DNA-binding transcriptional regulator, AcrR family [Actinoplanes derwentensis]